MKPLAACTDRTLLQHLIYAVEMHLIHTTTWTNLKEIILSSKANDSIIEYSQNDKIIEINNTLALARG